jgi:sulfur carrier protein
MKVQLNGETRTFEDGPLDLRKLLELLGFGEKPVLVEHNGVALHQREHGDTQVQDGDRLEIVLIVAGG